MADEDKYILHGGKSTLPDRAIPNSIRRLGLLTLLWHANTLYNTSIDVGSVRQNPEHIRKVRTTYPHYKVPAVSTTTTSSSHKNRPGPGSKGG